MSGATESTLEKVAAELIKEVTADLGDGLTQGLGSLEAARRETSEAAAKIIEVGSKQADSLRRQIIGSAELKSRNLELRAVEESVNEVFDAAIAKVGKASPTEYEKAITRLLTEGAGFLGGKASVSCRTKDRKLVSSVIRRLNRGSSRLSLSDKSVDTIGGIVLTSFDGAVKFDNTFEARLERLRPMLRKEVANLLAGGQA